VPVTCKIRCLPTEEATLNLAKRIEAAGCSLLTVHGRTREHKKTDTNSANWYIIKRIKETLSIPVIANGGIATYEDCIRCLLMTGCDGVMTSEAILEYPAIFDNRQIYDLDMLTLDYLEMVRKYPGEADLKCIRSHVHKFLHTGLKEHADLRERLSGS
jgi:tRNA-dihydrouridine synthase 1